MRLWLIAFVEVLTVFSALAGLLFLVGGIINADDTDMRTSNSALATALFTLAGLFVLVIIGSEIEQQKKVNRETRDALWQVLKRQRPPQ